MSELKIKLKIISDVSTLVEIALRNGYKATSKPIYEPEPYWNTKIDYFEVTLENLEQLKSQK